MPATTDRPVQLEFRDVTVGYRSGRPVLEDFSLQLRGTGVLQVAGRNGSGKSTFVEAASGYLRPTRGSVEVGGVAAHSPHARRRRRVCRTTPALYPNMTARDHLAFAARCGGHATAPGLERAVAYGLGPWLEQTAEALSTGNRRKLWLVMCTLGDPDLVLLDEPFNGLDAEGERVLRDELQGWARTACVLLVAHVLPVGLQVDEVVEMTAPAGPEEAS